MNGKKYFNLLVMKRIAFICLILMTLAGCAHRMVAFPTMDLPVAPTRPAIKSIVVPYQGSMIVGYQMNDAMKLYEYLLAQDAYADKLEDRIKVMNKLWAK